MLVLCRDVMMRWHCRVGFYTFVVQPFLKQLWHKTKSLLRHQEAVPRLLNREIRLYQESLILLTVCKQSLSGSRLFRYYFSKWVFPPQKWTRNWTELNFIDNNIYTSLQNCLPPLLVKWLVETGARVTHLLQERNKIPLLTN